MASVDVGQDFGNTNISGRAYGVILASIICPAVALLFVAGRWYVRLRVSKGLRFDDYLCLLTLFSNITYSVLQGLATQPYIGVGRLQDQFPKTQESDYYKWVFMFDTFYITSLFGYKMTILCLYARVFGVRTHFKWACWATMFIIAGYLIGALVSQLAGCNPPHKFWDMYVQGSCIDYKRFDITYGCLNVITDFMLTVLPLREIWRLFMPIKEKVWASCIFGSALLAFGTAIVSQVFRFHDLFSTDRTYDAGVTFVWQTIEINTGLICSCTPTLRPLYRKTAEYLTATFTGSQRSSQAERKVRKNLEREMHGEKLADTASNESSPEPAHGYTKDLEKGADSPAGIGLALSGGSNELDNPTRRAIPSHIYMSPLPSTEHERQERQNFPVSEHLDMPLPPAVALAPSDDERGRQPAKKRYSQAELEAMLREANAAKSQLEQQAERSRQRHEAEEEMDAEVDSHHGHDHAHYHDVPEVPAVPADTEKIAVRKKKSCDLEKGVGLRI